MPGNALFSVIVFFTFVSRFGLHVGFIFEFRRQLWSRPNRFFSGNGSKGVSKRPFGSIWEPKVNSKKPFGSILKPCGSNTAQHNTTQHADMWCIMYDVWCMMYDVWCMMYVVCRDRNRDKDRDRDRDRDRTETVTSRRYWPQGHFNISESLFLSSKSRVQIS